MDNLGERIIRDKAEAARKREEATILKAQAKRLLIDADEIERLLELAREARG